MSEEKHVPELSESLAGLVGAFDRFKETMGYSEDSEAMVQIQNFVKSVQQENITLRNHAEDAIMMAQRYKEANEDLEKENTSLYDQLTQARMSDMVSSTQSLTTAAYEFDREVVITKLAQAEEMMVYGAEMQERIQELEEENDALKQTLQEIREDQKQMHALRAAEVGEVPVYGSPESARLSEGMHVDSVESSPLRDQGTMSESSTYATPVNSTKKDDPMAIADALAAVAGGSESGMAASASKMLRGYHSLQAELEEVKAKNEELSKEVEELTETMTSKQFKAPSAWAEREVKYKLEKKEWEEQIEDKDAKIRALQSENDMLQSEQGTDDLNRKIVELESQIVVLNGKYQEAKASLHDMQVSSLMRAGEFSMSGVKPVSHEDDVRSMVDKIESESESHEVSSSRQTGTHQLGAEEEHAMNEQLVILQKEKQDIINKITEAEEADNTKSLLAQAEIALLETGIDMDSAAKIVELENKLHQESNDADAIQEEALSVAPALKRALASPSSGVLQSLKVAGYVVDDEGHPPSSNGAAPELEEHVVERIANLKLQIHVGKEEQSMPAGAAAGMAAVHRAQSSDIDRLKSQLHDAAQREEELKRKIEEIKVKPVNLRLSMEPSTLSSSSPHMANLASERKDADKAWEDHQKKSDLTAILREKAELEAKHDMAKSQLSKVKEALEAANQEKQALQKAVKHALATGDMNALSTAHENYSKKKKASSPLKKLRGRGIFSRKSGSRPSSAQDDAAPPDENLRIRTASAAVELPSPGDSIPDHDDSVLIKQVHDLTDENEMLMDQLVTTKVRLAEVEGDCLESRRALLRAKEKQMDLARQLHDQRVSQS